MRWLHLTDIHCGRGDDEAQATALRSLIAAVERFTGNTPVDAVLLTGDIVFSGKAAEYESFERQILEPLRRLPAYAMARVIAVPGNHDLNCDVVFPARWEDIDPQSQNALFQNTPRGIAARAPRSGAFTEFSAFLTRNSIVGVDPLSQVSAVAHLGNADNQFAILCVNTALLSHKSKSDEHLSPAPALAVRTLLDTTADVRHRLVVGHHPISWFQFPTQEPFRTLLLDHNAVYLHGHSHAISVEFTVNGLRSFGFGASYQAPLDNPVPSFYENSFALCELDDALHVAVVSWDTQHGRWSSASRLPGEFRHKSPRLASGGFVFQLTSQMELAYGAGEPSRRAPSIERVVAVTELSPEAIEHLLRRLSILPAPQVTPQTVGGPEGGTTDLTYRHEGSIWRVRFIHAHGHMLSAREIEAANTSLDRDGLSYFLIVSLGDIAEEAHTLANQLARRKNLRILVNANLSQELARGLVGPLQAHVSALDAAVATVSAVLYDVGLGLLVQDKLRTDWFYLVGVDGAILDEASPVVGRMRETRGDLTAARYRHPDASDSGRSTPVPEPFDRGAYLQKCQAEQDTLKYAPLAAVGIRLPDATLESVYVPATADTSDATSESATLRQAVNDLVESFGLDEAQRVQVELQLKERVLGTVPSHESGAAQALYQQYGNVLVLGDPGSGKTCFVKSEMLSYCRPQADADSWYRRHTPIHVPLAEAAPIFARGGDLLATCSEVCARRGLAISRSQLAAIASDGLAAFFFDGLDEVASIEERAQLVEAIRGLLSESGRVGSRFVVTSRPAAVQMVELPRGLKILHLRGLTDLEMRTLARNVMRIEVAPGDGVRMSEQPLRHEDEATVERLLEDCRTTAGIRRLARNPLLLTLLVMIYANSGPLAAKRHRVYAQAVQTLVSVRNRTSGQQVLSEADLRNRLGYVALALYRSVGAGMPTVEEVSNLLEEALRREGRTESVASDARAFLQLVAEATGILLIHERRSFATHASVSFLHHSFLEYYCALGLLDEDDVLVRLPDLVEHLRWQEVISVMAGIAGDRSDVTPLLKAVMQEVGPADTITHSRLIFALDCALECDVPPEAAQEMLAEAVHTVVERGMGLVDPDLRRVLGERLGRLLAASGSPHFRRILSQGMTSAKAQVSAAFVELAGRVGAYAPLGADAVAAFDAAANRGEPLIDLAVYNAMERVPALRTEAAANTVRHGLAGSAGLRFGALRTVALVPGLASSAWSEVVGCLDDSNAYVAAMAARAVLEGGLEVHLGAAHGRHLLERCLRQWERVASPQDATKVSLRSSRETIGGLLSSPDQKDRLLAIRLLPWLDREETFVSERVFEIVRATDSSKHDEVVAALASIRFCSGAIVLASASDLDRLLQLLKAPDRDTRIGACRALAAFPIERCPIDSLIEYAQTAGQNEFREAIRALVQHGEENEQIKKFLLREARDRLAGPAQGHFGDDTGADRRRIAPARGRQSGLPRHAVRNEVGQADLRRVLKACEELGVGPDEVVDARLMRIMSTFKAPRELRRQALRTFGRVGNPGQESVKWFITQLKGSDSVLGPSLGSAVRDLVAKARLRVEHVKSIYPLLPALEAAVVARCGKQNPAGASRIQDNTLRGLRSALTEIRELLVGYGDFASFKRG